MDDVERLTRLVTAPELADDLADAWELVTFFLGTALPDDFTALVDRFGAGSFQVSNDDYHVYFDLWGPRELFLFGPQNLQVSKAFRDADDRSSSFGSVDARPEPPLTRLDLRFMADWPLWPEANGAIPIGGADGDDLHLLRHHGRWSLGWALHEWGVTEADTTTASWIHGWLAGEHSLTGEAADPRPSGVAISFDPRPTAIHLAELSPSTEPFEVRAELLAHTGAVRRDFVASLEPPPLAPISVVRYASAGWQRLDLSVADTSPSGSAAGWYDDAVDGSGRHRVGILVPPRQPQAASAIDRVAALLGSRVLDVQVL